MDRLTKQPLREKSFRFSLSIVKLYKYLTKEHKEFVLSKQLLRSGTAIGALVAESRYAESRADFLHKLTVALKEASESEYWIEILYESGYLETAMFKSIQGDIKELLRLLVSITNSIKNPQ